MIPSLQTHVHIHTLAHTPTHLCTHTHSCAQAFTHLCMYLHTNTTHPHARTHSFTLYTPTHVHLQTTTACTHRCAHSPPYACTHNTHVFTQLLVHTHAHTNTNLLIHMHTHDHNTYTHTQCVSYTQSPLLSLPFPSPICYFHTCLDQN